MYKIRKMTFGHQEVISGLQLEKFANAGAFLK